jgi:hypothetical protein
LADRCLDRLAAILQPDAGVTTYITTDVASAPFLWVCRWRSTRTFIIAFRTSP